MDRSRACAEWLRLNGEDAAWATTVADAFAKAGGEGVLETYVHDDVETYVVETSAGAVTSTAEHPFYVEGKGWIPVRSLEPGDLLVDPDGVAAKVVDVVPTSETATVYNLRVEDLHNYHVAVGAQWVRVHNDCTDPLKAAEAGPLALTMF